jgi:hypothetical protein
MWLLDIMLYKNLIQNNKQFENKQWIKYMFAVVILVAPDVKQERKSKPIFVYNARHNLRA